MARAWLALGANIGDPPVQLAEAVRTLSAHPALALLSASSMIVTEPWGMTEQPRFHNMAVGIETTLAPNELLDICLAVETAMGRMRAERWGPRLIDIDVIAYERIEMESLRLTLPHPRAHERDFVLVPLRQIAPDTTDWIISRKR